MIEILLDFLKIGATGYGGPAIIGVMQTEFHAAYVGDKTLGVGGAVVAAAASFLPSFVLTHAFAFPGLLLQEGVSS